MILAPGCYRSQKSGLGSYMISLIRAVILDSVVFLESVGFSYVFFMIRP